MSMANYNITDVLVSKDEDEITFMYKGDNWKQDLLNYLEELSDEEFAGFEDEA